MQIAFARSYVRCMNASQAAKEAGYKHPYKMGNQLIHHPAIVAEIDRLRAKIERQIIKPGEVIQHTVNIMRGNIADVMDWGFTDIEVPKTDGSTVLIPQPWVKAIPRDELPREVTDAIAEVSLTDKGAFKIKMHDKGAAIDKLMRHLGLYEKDNEQMLMNCIADCWPPISTNWNGRPKTAWIWPLTRTYTITSNGNRKNWKSCEIVGKSLLSSTSFRRR